MKLIELEDAVPAALAMLAAATSLFAVAEVARADDAYVCEGGRIAFVRHGDLERVALTDPCIAAYAARRRDASPRGAGAASGAALVTHASDEPPLPVRRPQLSASTPVSRQPVEPPPHATAVLPDQLTPRVTPVVFPSGAAPRWAPAAGSGTGDVGNIDFRNVPIINATEGSPRIFRHLR